MGDGFLLALDNLPPSIPPFQKQKWGEAEACAFQKQKWGEAEACAFQTQKWWEAEACAFQKQKRGEAEACAFQKQKWGEDNFSTLFLFFKLSLTISLPLYF